MQLIFDSIDEVHDFVSKLKKTRGGKGGDAEAGEGQPATGQAPAPIMPQTTQTFNPNPAGGSFPGAGGGFPVTGAAAGPDPAIAAIIGRIKAKYDAGAAMSAESASQALAWLRGQCGNTPDLANMTPDQIWQFKVPSLQMAQLENMAKLMNA